MIQNKVLWVSLFFLASCGVGRSFIRKDYMELCPLVSRLREIFKGFGQASALKTFIENCQASIDPII